MAIVCPGCRQALEASDVQCPVCLRSRSPREIARAIREQDPAYMRRRFWGARSTRVMGLGLAVVAFAYVGNKRDWFPRTRLYDFAMNALKRGTEAADAPRPAPAQVLPKEPEAPKPEILYKINERGFIDVGPNPPPSAGAEPPLPGQKIAALAAPEIKAKVDKRWLVKGKVYDLLTLKPVAGAKVSFVAKRRGRIQAAETGADGLYQVRLHPAEWGYDVEFSHPRYGALYLEEAAVPYSSRPIEKRREERDAMHSSQIVHLPLMLEGPQREIRHDLVVSEQ